MTELAQPVTAYRAVARPARPLLVAGALAGPIYVVVGAVEAAARDGFDITRHSLSLLANGDGGWVHSAMMVITGLLTVAGAVGLARTPAAHRSPWAIRGLFVYGAGVAAGGLMRADPMDGFPIGTPDGPPGTVTWHGMGHLAAGGIGFLGLIVACLVLARAFGRRRQRGWAVFSLVTGVYYVVAFAGIATGAGNGAVIVAFCVAVMLGWTWITLLMYRAARSPPH
ncbi:DUF998 domain-containing protein [Actinomycetes bacterium KLBMP 9797]